MTSSITGIQLALPDTDGVYKKTKRLYMGTAGLDTSTGGIFVKLSGVGVIKSLEVPSGEDGYGIIMDGVPAATAAQGSDDLYVDVYTGLQNKFIATVNTCSDASALLNGATVFIASTGNSLSLASAGLDIIGTIENGAQSVSAGSRVIFSLTPSTAIAGYDSGNTT